MESGHWWACLQGSSGNRQNRLTDLVGQSGRRKEMVGQRREQPGSAHTSWVTQTAIGGGRRGSDWGPVTAWRGGRGRAVGDAGARGPMYTWGCFMFLAGRIQRTWVWASSASWWWEGEAWRAIGLQRVGHDWVNNDNGRYQSHIVKQLSFV